MTTSVRARLEELGYPLPEPVAPLAAYVPAVRSGSLIFTAGQLPMVDGKLLARGLVAENPIEEAIEGWVVDSEVIDVEAAKLCAARCALNGLAAISTVLDDLDKIVRVVKVTGFVAGVPGFIAHPQVVNGASEFLGDVFLDAGRHARSAVGVASLPLGSPVEVELVVEVAD